ncbi:MAG: NADH-quinone oxidoreductase subunit L [Candidatus Coatesbacteria bacterium]|nr:MAG: NADH-quinone oxidoreductase subunit L [Candidatus Coatesbacteria bacterium]RLC43807.1 MAG: NADH-quinone oxidoreductase subunit L [Candidatus Coatesbacteria bacterium]RLC44996.1 MAG: NADH-quinone oxidoreductase subunit L [Candidatus Coatesbacteria bacterium]
MNPVLPVLIFALPVLSFGITVLIGRYFPLKGASVGILGLVVSFILSCVVFYQLQVDPTRTIDLSVTWLDFGEYTIDLGILIDRFAAVMLVVVTLVSLCVHIYSLGYMKGDRRFTTYYAYLSLFTMSMLGIVISNNLFQLFVFWELVGVSSYLLIGFWFERKPAAMAGMKAFVVCRIGDFGFLIGILSLFVATGTFSFGALFGLSQAGAISSAVLVVGALGIFFGAVGKSAQLPLYVWLPDAMEGPTPVSALIHAATMVAAGVYLVARTLPIFSTVPQIMEVVAWVGGLTALFSATIAVAQVDIKRILAYSTISQLGYMMLACGVGAGASAIFHLSTHAFFKALLFLGAGSVIHSLHTNDIREMGGLFSNMKTTATVFIIGALSLAGFPPFSGFFSKDEIMVSVLESGHVWLYWIVVFTAFLTAFYIFRLIFIAFFGEQSERSKHAEESPKVMTVPMVVLAVLSVVAGWIAIPGVGPGFAEIGGFELHHLHINWSAMGTSFLVVLMGIGVAWAIYSRRFVESRSIYNTFKPISKLLENKWYVDEIYNFFIVQPVIFFSRLLFAFDMVIVDGAVNLAGWLGVRLSKFEGEFDLAVVDGAVNGTAWTARTFGRAVRRIQTGLIQEYVIVASVAILALIIIGYYLM